MAAIMSYAALEEVLREQFPTVEVEIKTFDYGNRLGLAINKGGTRFHWATPEDYDYRSQPMEYWLHRFSEAIRDKLK